MNLKYKEFLRKHTTEDIVNKMDEDAPTNAVGTGANVALPPKHEPGVKPGKRDPLMFSKPIKRKDDEDIKKKLGLKIKENNDNNNIVLKGILDKIDSIETALDEKYIGKTEIKIEEEKEYKTFKDKYNA